MVSCESGCGRSLNRLSSIMQALINSVRLVNNSKAGVEDGSARASGPARTDRRPKALPPAEVVSRPCKPREYVPLKADSAPSAGRSGYALPPASASLPRLSVPGQACSRPHAARRAGGRNSSELQAVPPIC